MIHIVVEGAWIARTIGRDAERCLVYRNWGFYVEDLMFVIEGIIRVWLKLRLRLRLKFCRVLRVPSKLASGSHGEQQSRVT